MARVCTTQVCLYYLNEPPSDDEQYCRHCGGFMQSIAAMHASTIRKTSRAFWQGYFNYRKCPITVSDIITITSKDTYGDPFKNEHVVYDYCDDSHINVITATGVHIGIPTCYVIDVVKE